jgi:predicted site-specific integrase-resolvase
VSFCNARGYKVKKVIKEIGSGLNDQRPKLEKLLLDKEIDVIVVEHKDRLARFGLNYIQKLLALQGREIEIVNEVESERDDLMQDFVSIITSFCARLYGKKRTKRMTEKLVKKLEEDKDAISGETSSERE